MRPVLARNFDERRKLWDDIRLGTTTGWPDGRAFEYLIVHLFECDGAKVNYPFHVPSPIGGIMEQLDGFIQIDGLNVLIEAKDYKENVNVEPITKLRNQLLRRPAGVIGCLFSKAGFTDNALLSASFMAPQAILLWTGVEVDALVNGSSIRDALAVKYSRLMRDGMPYFDFRGELP